MKKPSKTQIIRHIIQLIAFLLFPELFIVTFSAIKEIYTAVINGSFQVAEQMNRLLLLAAVFPITAFFGRFFCGYLCSFGAIGDLLWFVSSKTLKKPITVGQKTERVLKCLKYAVLLFVVIVVWTIALPIDSSYNPWTVFGMYSSPKGWTNTSVLLSVGGGLLLLIFIGSFLIERFFCRYLCPLGAIFTLLSRFRLYRIKKPRNGCGACGLCTKKCGMGIPLNETDTVRSGECIDCFQCLDVCPRENVSATPVPAVAGTAAAITIAGLYCVGTIAPIKPKSENIGIVAAAANTVNKYADGVYTGKGNGFRGTTSVKVTVQNGLISDITVVSTDDDRSFFNSAQSVIIPEIIRTQSLDVAAVSGATFSSNGILEAVADALETEFKDAPDSNPPETSDTESSSNKTPNNAPSDNSSPSANGQTGELELGSMEDGEYTGVGTGFRGEVKVIVKIENKVITSITVVSYQDDQKYFKRAQSGVISEIIRTQSLDVAAVSGATFSSNGILEAAANALNVSFSNPNSDRAHGGQNHGYNKGHGKGFGSRQG